MGKYGDDLVQFQPEEGKGKALCSPVSRLTISQCLLVSPYRSSSHTMAMPAVVTARLMRQSWLRNDSATEHDLLVSSGRVCISG